MDFGETDGDVSFKKLHFPKIKKYLGLPPGSRFLFAEGHEDVWQDPTLLNE